MAEQVLPLQVLPKTTITDERLRSLPEEDVEALEQLRDDYHNDHLRHFAQHVRDVAWKDSKEAKAEFNVASRRGNDLIKKLASGWNCEVAGAARGEWGLIFHRQHLRIAVSLKLGRNMELAYNISISDDVFAISLCFRHHYLGALGIGSSAWIVETANQFPDKLLKATEFALWHKSEYDRMIDLTLWR